MNPRFLLVALSLLVFPLTGISQSITSDSLAHYLTGSFTNAEQAKNTDEVPELQLLAKRIWIEKQNGVWLYWERSESEDGSFELDQKVVQIIDEGKNRFSLYFFDIANAEDYRGGKTKKLDKLMPEHISSSNTCEVRLVYVNKAFVGNTQSECDSDFNGASILAIEMKAKPGILELSEMGFNAEGTPKWGSSKPIVFKNK